MKLLRRQIFPFLILVVVFGYFVWRIDLPAVHVLVLQYRAEAFQEVQGRIVSGEVYRTYGSKGSVYYHPSFRYKYQVTGRSYTGWRYRYDAHPFFWDSAPAEQIVRAHPAGSEIEVYYNPADPRDSVLSKPVEGFDLGFLLFGSGVGLLLLGSMMKFGRALAFPGRAAPIAGGVKIISEGMTTRVRLPRRDPLSWSMFIIGFPSCILGFLASQIMDMKLQVVEMIMLFVALAGAAVYFWLQRKITSGSQDLMIDEAARTLGLPLTFKRRERMECAYSDITGVSLEKVAHRGRYGVRYTYAPTLHIAGKPSQRVADLSKERAESFASWLREKIGLPAEAGATPVEK